MSTKFGTEEQSMTRVQHTAGINGHAQLIHGQPEIKSVLKTVDQSVTHCWGHRLCISGQQKVKLNLLWPPKLFRTPELNVTHCCTVTEHADVTWGQPNVNC